MTEPDTFDTPLDSDAGPLVAGKWVIIVIFAFSIVASSVSWIYYARLQQRPLALWGPNAAQLMMHAPRAKLFRLVPAAEVAEPTGSEGSASREFDILGKRYVARDARDISRAGGFSHIRQSLVHDRSFAWDAPACAKPPEWTYAIQFDDDTTEAVIFLAFDCDVGTHAGGDTVVSILPVAREIESFVREQYPAEAPAKAPSAP